MQSCAVCADQAKVAPFAGAWIEIMLFRCRQILVIVAPFAGAWIEILNYYLAIDGTCVAPFAGAWIEICAVMAG